jgi:hypothetical protein
MTFAEEPVGFSGRRFECGWSERPQTAGDIAERVQDFARRLRAIDPASGRLRPDPGMRRFRPGDLGPIVDMTPAELGDLIDREDRADPPRFPAPVGPTGYRVLYRSDHLGRDPSSLTVAIRAGAYGPGPTENRVDVRPDVEHPIWRDPELGIELLGAMIEAWEPEWVCAYARTTEPLPPEGGESRSRIRPWLAWSARPLQPRPVPPFNRPYPHPFPLDDAGPPAEVRAFHGGELKMWP